MSLKQEGEIDMEKDWMVNVTLKNVMDLSCLFTEAKKRRRRILFFHSLKGV